MKISHKHPPRKWYTTLKETLTNLTLSRKQTKAQNDLTTQILRINPEHQAYSPKTSQNELLLRFFRNETDDIIPHRHEDVVVYDDNQMEMYHDFIQWIFPTKRPSIMHPEAPIIDENFAEMLCADKCARKNYCKS